MMDDNEICKFVKDYTIFANRVLNLEKKARSHKELPIGEALGRISPFNLEYISTDEEILRSTEKLFSYQLKGLVCKYERLLGRSEFSWSIMNADQKLEPHQIIERLLYPIKYITNDGWNLDINVQDQKAISIFELYAYNWMQNSWAYTVITPVYNLNYKIDKNINLGKFVLTSKVDFSDVPPYISIKSDTFLVQETFIDTRILEDSCYQIDEIEEELEKIITYFRLFLPSKTLKSSGIGADFIYFIPKLPRKEKPYTPHATRENLRVLKMNNYKEKKEILTEKIGEHFNTFIGETSLYNQLKLAICRFNHAFERESYEDKVTDLIISLEKCILNQDKELSYRLSLRTAKLLKTEQSPAYTFKLIDTAYKIRSSIFHKGENFTGEKIKDILKNWSDGSDIYIMPNDFIFPLRETVRKTIVKIINISRNNCEEYQNTNKNGKILEDIVKQIDNKILLSL